MNQKRIKSNVHGKTPLLNKGKNYGQVLEALFVDSAKMINVDIFRILKLLDDENIAFTVIGGIIVGCHSGRPRATQDLDLVVGVNKLSSGLIAKLGKIVSAKKVEHHPSFISFVVDSVIGDREVLDIITSKSGSYGLALENTKSLNINGIKINIPTPEMMVVLKYTAAVNPIRTKAKQAQDMADIYAIIDANKKFDRVIANRLADLVVPGYGEDLLRRIK